MKGTDIETHLVFSFFLKIYADLLNCIQCTRTLENMLCDCVSDCIFEKPSTV